MIASTKSVILWSLVILLAMASELNAFDFSLTASTDATWSDNIYRNSPGLEESGSLITLEAILEVNEQWGRGSYSLLAGGGLETIDNGVSSTEEINSFRLEVILPVYTTSLVEGYAETSKGTETPEPGDIDQDRILTTYSEVGLIFATRFATASSYQAEIYQNTEESEDLDLKETNWDLQWSSNLDRRRSIFLQGRITTGEEAVADSSWDEFYAVMRLSDQIRPVALLSYEVDWNEFNSNLLGGTMESSYQVSLLVRYEAELVASWTYINELGIDHMVSYTGRRIWEPRAEISILGLLSRTVEANGTVLSAINIGDPLEAGTEWTRENRLEAGLNWNVLSTFSIAPRALYLLEDIHVENASDIEDRTFLYGVNTSWTPSSAWTVEFGGVIERRTSSDPLREMEESRLELSISTTYP